MRFAAVYRKRLEVEKIGYSMHGDGDAVTLRMHHGGTQSVVHRQVCCRVLSLHDDDDDHRDDLKYTKYIRFSAHISAVD